MGADAVPHQTAEVGGVGLHDAAVSQHPRGHGCCSLQQPRNLLGSHCRKICPPSSLKSHEQRSSLTGKSLSAATSVIHPVFDLLRAKASVASAAQRQVTQDE